MTPFATWTGQKPNIKHPGVFGWEVYACMPKHERKEIASKARECIRLSYIWSRGYIISVPTKTWQSLPQSAWCPAQRIVTRKCNCGRNRAKPTHTCVTWLSEFEEPIVDEDLLKTKSLSLKLWGRSKTTRLIWGMGNSRKFWSKRTENCQEGIVKSQKAKWVKAMERNGIA